METYNTSLSNGMTRVAELYQHIKRYCLHPALAELAIVNMKIFRKDPSVENLFPATINEHQLAFLAKALILNSNDHKRENFEQKGLFDSAALYNNLYDKLLDVSEDEENPKRLEALNTFLIRMSYQQFPFQIRVGHLIPRALFLFDQIPQTLKNPAIDIKSEIVKIYGLTPKQILTIGFAIFASSKDGYFRPEHLFNTQSPELQKHLTKEAVEKLVSALTADYNKLRELFRTDEGEDGLQQYAFNALRTYPIVQTQIAGLVIPVPRFILERITNGIFYSLMEKFRTDKSNPFLEFFGKELFERYVGILLAEKYKGKELLKEFEYSKGAWSPDWIIFEGDEAILIECKTSGITKEAKSWAEVEKLRADLRARVVHAIIQMNSFMEKVKKGLVKRPELQKIKLVHYVVVTYDRIYLSGSPPIRGYIDQELSDKGLKDVDYQILGIDEIEKLIPILNTFKFSELIKLKATEERWSTSDFDLFISNYLQSKNLNLPRENLLLETKYQEYLKEISPNLSLKKKI